ncbi:MAG: histidinol-phosphatase [Clostridia bacterium]|jgi:histidinol-phosphatase (PHP family)|nr:histidinol-phosphatase [Clostridia bacterium]
MRDYHTHTFRCKHAQGDVEDYAKYAVEYGIDVLGVSDHTALPDNWIPEIRMDISELPDYVEAIEKAQKKYPQLRILKGMECEYEKKYYSFFQEELLGKWGFDYLILGQHLFYCDGQLVYFWKDIKGAKELKVYTDLLVSGMESGLFTFVAHPDAFGSFYLRWDEEAKACSRYIIEAAEAYHLPLEINGHGFRKGEIKTAQGVRLKYPLPPFWELASQYNVQVLVNSDAHQPQEVGAFLTEGQELVERYGLEIIDLLEFLEL